MKRKGSSGRKLPGIYTRGNIFWFTYRLNGKKYAHSLETGDYGEAVKKALEIRQNPVLTPAAVFTEEINAFVSSKRECNEYSGGSAKVKILVLKEFAAFCAKANPRDVTAAQVTSFYRRLQGREPGRLRGKVEETTAQGYLATIRSFYEWLRLNGKVRVNPVVGIKLDRVDHKGRDKFCLSSLRDTLIDGCKRDDLKLILYLGFHAGLRRTEITEARPEWFDLEAGMLKIAETETFKPKDREARSIPLTKEFQRFLAIYGLPKPFVLRPDKPSLPPLKTRKPDDPTYRYDFRRPFDDHMKAHGCPWVTPHVMRHTFASLLASASVSIYMIAKWLGDDVRVTEKHYAKLVPAHNELEKAYRQGF